MTRLTIAEGRALTPPLFVIGNTIVNMTKVTHIEPGGAYGAAWILYLEGGEHVFASDEEGQAFLKEWQLYLEEHD